MPQEVLDYLNVERLGVLAVGMPDGSPHGATVHFAHLENPLRCIFITAPTSKKFESLKNGGTKASFTVGVSEDILKTFQADGELAVSDSEDLRRMYFEKFPQKIAKHSAETLLVFTPTWWRFTDYKAPQGRLILSSDDQK